MINFACKCGHRFSVLDDMSGGSVQCPDCRLLVDVPYAGDRMNLEEDGTFRVEEVPLKEEQQEINPRAVPYFRPTVPGAEEDEGDTYDLRPTPEEIMRAGYEEQRGADGLVVGTPKYDPETGELLRPMPMKKDESPRPDDVPVARTAIGYASGATDHVSPGMVPLRLLLSTNGFVLGLIFFAHLCNEFFVVAILGGIVLVILAPIVIMAVLLAHFGCVVDEIAICERDELPTPLRSMSLGDDFGLPLMRCVSALALCYGPAIYLLFRVRLLAALAALCGSVVFPAVLLTILTSGTIVNLRPDRVLGMMRACGGVYVALAGMWLVTGSLYLVSLLIVIYHGAHFLGAVWIFMWIDYLIPSASSLLASQPVAAALPYVAYPLLLVAVYLMHLFLWYLGLLYRGFHAQFPWVLQRHIPSLKVERRFQQLRRQKAGKAKGMTGDKVAG